MDKLLGILLFSFAATLVAAVPFINLLYKLKFQRQKEQQVDFQGESTSVVNRLHSWKAGTPNAGGILVILVTIVLSTIFYVFTQYELNWTARILYISLISFGVLGFYDDVNKFAGKKKGTYGLRVRYKFLLQWAVALGIGWLLYYRMGLDTVHIPYVGYWNLGIYYIAYSAFVIVATTNAVNITDGLDGLVTGLMVIALSALWYLSTLSGLGDINLFIAVITGSLLAFLYFNIYPARVWLGDTGALSLGAMLAVISLMINESFSLLFIGGVLVLETLSSLIQMLSKTVSGKKIFLAAPLHHHFEAKGWDETKVTMRFWLAGAFFAYLGLFIALTSK